MNESRGFGVRGVGLSGYQQGWISISLFVSRGPHPRETLWGPTPTAASASLRSAPLFSNP